MKRNIIDRKIVLWGTGKIASKFFDEFAQLNIFCCIDNDETRIGSVFYGCKVMKHEILKNNAENFFVIVASSYYTEISQQLRSYGFHESVDYVSYCNIKNELYDYEEDLREKIDYIKNGCFQNKILLFFCLQEYDAKEKGLASLFEKLNSRLGGKLLFMQEAIWLPGEKTKAFLDVPFLTVPLIMGRDKYVCKNDFFVEKNQLIQVSLSFEKEEQITKVKEDNELKNIACNLRLKYPQMAKGFENYMIILIMQYMEELVDSMHPEIVILWNEFYAVHELIKYVCIKKGIPVKYIEFGNLPGTVQFDGQGQMGESWVACESDIFQELPICQKDVVEAKKIWKFLYDSKANRKKQPKTDILENIGAYGNLARPVIVFAGQNDYESGIQPYTYKTEKYHSPIFVSSNEAAVYLYELCKKRGWSYIYKPHPIMAGNEDFHRLPKDMVLIKRADINDIVDIADVVVTILSTTAYVSLIRNKATLMLGYTQLKGKGCTYEAFKKEDIEGKLEAALENGFCEEQRTAFLKHLALMAKYYLYCNVDERQNIIKFGKEMEEFYLETIK